MMIWLFLKAKPRPLRGSRGQDCNQSGLW